PRVEDAQSGLHLIGAQFGRGTRRARAQIGQRHPEPGELLVLGKAERLGHQARSIQKPPERISRTRKMMPDRFGAETRVYPHEQDARVRRDDVAERHEAIIASYQDPGGDHTSGTASTRSPSVTASVFRISGAAARCPCSARAAAFTARKPRRSSRATRKVASPPLDSAPRTIR